MVERRGLAVWRALGGRSHGRPNFSIGPRPPHRHSCRVRCSSLSPLPLNSSSLNHARLCRRGILGAASRLCSSCFPRLVPASHLVVVSVSMHIIQPNPRNAALTEAQDVLTSGVIGADAVFGTLESVGCDWDMVVVVRQDEVSEIRRSNGRPIFPNCAHNAAPPEPPGQDVSALRVWRRQVACPIPHQAHPRVAGCVHQVVGTAVRCRGRWPALAALRSKALSHVLQL